jgi:hypothetical protein
LSYLSVEQGEDYFSGREVSTERGLEVDHAALTVLHVAFSRLDQLLELLSSQIERRREIPGGGTALDERVSMCFHLSAQ